MPLSESLGGIALLGKGEKPVQRENPASTGFFVFSLLKLTAGAKSPVRCSTRKSAPSNPGAWRQIHQDKSAVQMGCGKHSTHRAAFQD